MPDPGRPEQPGERQRENHRRPDEFGRSVAQRALEEARRRKGGQDPEEQVVIEATITVTPGTWSVCANFGLFSVCYTFD